LYKVLAKRKVRRLVRLALEVREREDAVRLVVRAASIQRAVDTTRCRYPDHEVRVVFPIDEGGFFADPGEQEEIEEDPVPAGQVSSARGR
jgi:hypothetical protein